MDPFLLRNYELHVRYLSDHFSRMWTRFNFFLTINSALFGFSFNSSYAHNVTYISWAGIVFSLVWFYFGGVDNRLVDIYREHVKTSFDTIKKALQTSPVESADGSAAQKNAVLKELRFAGSTEPLPSMEKRLWSFRWEHASATDLATILPIVFALAWMIRLWLAGGS
jgi:hypothetical protein